MSEYKISRPRFIKTGEPIEFSPEVMERVRALMKRYPDGQKKSALIPVLHIAQEEFGGYLTADIMDYIASLLDLLPIEVYEVATFYSMFYLEPVGKYVLEVCRTGPCAIAGGESIREYLKQALNINPGETTPDGLFTLKEVECLGSCGTAPVLQVNTEFYEQLNPERIDLLLDELRGMAGKQKQNYQRWAEQYC